MGISLAKGGNASLTKAAPGLQTIRVGLGWDVRATSGTEFDLDASALLLDASSKMSRDDHFIFYNNRLSPCRSVECGEDNRSGSGEGDDETIQVRLGSVPADVARIALCASIHEGAQRRQNFGQVQNAYIRVVNDADGQEILRFDLSEDYSTETSLIFGELYRHQSEWKFKAVGQGFDGGLEALLRHFGINV